MKIEIDINSETADVLTLENLKQSYKYLFNNVDKTIPIFSFDQEKETKEIKKLLTAFEKVMGWYGVDMSSIKSLKLASKLEMEKTNGN
jgi:hypothetical protein